MDTFDKAYDTFVAGNCKPGEHILESLTPEQAEAWHMATGHSGEAGELLDAIKKWVIYQRPADMNKMHHRLVGLLAVVSLGIGLATLGRAHDEKGAKKTFVGHVVDLACYVGHGSIGESHRECAATCARGGIPLAILDQATGTLYLPLAKDHHAPANKELLPFVEADVRVSGSVVEKDGMKTILLESLAAAD